MQSTCLAGISDLIIELYGGLDADRRLLIGVSGVPGSGKSMIAQQIARLLQVRMLPDHHVIVVGMDGWHLTRTQLDGLPDPVLAHKRRGAHYTFDGEAFACFVEQLRQPIQELPSISAPTFDHALKDPQPCTLQLTSASKIVIVEGLYCNTSIQPWRRAAECFDVRVLVQASAELCLDRIVERHLESGVANTLAEARERAELSDRANGNFVLDNLLTPLLLIDNSAHRVD